MSQTVPTSPAGIVIPQVITNYITSAIRTATSYLVAWLLSLAFMPHLLAYLGVNSTNAKEWMSALITFGLGTLWYLIVRALEHKWPKFGVLLGVPIKPTYAKLATIDATSTPAGTVPVITDAPVAPTAVTPQGTVLATTLLAPAVTPPVAQAADAAGLSPAEQIAALQKPVS